MDLGKLQELGLSQNESQVYFALLQIGQASATELSKRSGLHRAVVYDNLDRLVEKGLVSFISEGKRKQFQINSPEMLIELLEKEKEGIASRLEIAEKLKKEAQKVYLHQAEKQDARMLRGKRGVKVLFQDILEQKDPYVSFGAPKNSVDIMGETFWKSIDIKTFDKKMKIKLIFNESLRLHGRKISRKMSNISVKYIDLGFDALTQTVVYDRKVAVIVWTKHPIITLISDKNVVDSYNSYFNILWKIAKK